LRELFAGSHVKLEQAYSPMNIRFFLLQAHYRSTLDFSNDALQAAEKGLTRLMKAVSLLKNLKPAEKSTFSPDTIITKCFEALNDDLNTPVAIAQLFEAVRLINLMSEGLESLTADDAEKLISFMESLLYSILGLTSEGAEANKTSREKELIEFIISLRLEARNRKDFTASDAIRDKLATIGIILKDGKEGTTWEIN
jgi:cysteinyl-tRNA synthetase